MKSPYAILLLVSLSSPVLAREGGGSSVGTGNPASQFCLDLGGKLERYVNHEGEGSNCAIEEWALFREMDGKGLVKPIHCRPGTPCMPNPAAKNCEDIGGKTRTETAPTGEQDICVVEEWKLFGVFHH